MSMHVCGWLFKIIHGHMCECETQQNISEKSFLFFLSIKFIQTPHVEFLLIHGGQVKQKEDYRDFSFSFYTQWNCFDSKNLLDDFKQKTECKRCFLHTYVYFPDVVTFSVNLPAKGSLCLPVETCRVEVIASEFLSCLGGEVSQTIKGWGQLRYNFL